ncbi:MAG: glycosyltransferase family 4 protein [Pseudomonadota bacterium]
MKVTQIVCGKFHHFHLARQLDHRGLLNAIWTGYPRAKLRDEPGVAPARIRTYPHWYVAYALTQRVGALRRMPWLVDGLFWQSVDALDRKVARWLDTPDLVVALSGSGLHAGRRAQALGGRYVCDRGSTHITYQRDLLTQEYRDWGVEPPRFFDAIVDKELAEYDTADCITVPSSFVAESFIERGVPREKMRLIPYGGRLDRFQPVGAPDPNHFTLLFVGGISPRKGIPYLLQAFERFRHPGKRLRIIGSPEPGIEDALSRLPRDRVEFLGQVPNTELARHYSAADALVLPSIEEGLAMVMGEALACGCPVIATTNTGAAELFEHGEQGFILPIRDIDALVGAMTQLADQPGLAGRMRAAARERIQRIGGWDSYGKHWASIVETLSVSGARTTRPAEAQ